MALTDPESTPVDDGGRSRDRAVIARIAAAERWARTSDRTAATEPARRGLRARFEREADPDGVLGVAERARRADALMTAHMLRLARASAKARRSATRRGGSG
jgi:hypothetical protein